MPVVVGGGGRGRIRHDHKIFDVLGIELVLPFLFLRSTNLSSIPISLTLFSVGVDRYCMLVY